MNPNLLDVSAKSSLKDKSNYKPKIDTQEVARLLKEGKKRSEIAHLLGARPNAIDYHIAKIRNGQYIEPNAVLVKKDYNKLIDWRIYNEGLVKRGEILIDLDIFKDWGEELIVMNKGKVGAPYQYPESYIEFLLRLKSSFKIGYRQTEGIGRKLVCFIQGAKSAPDYTTIQQRFEGMEIELKVYQGGEGEIAASDSTGIKTSNRGEYKAIRYENKKKKEYVKLHIMVNIKTQEVIGLEVTLGEVHDSQVIGSLVVQGIKNGGLKRELLDSGYDGKKVYGLHLEKGIEAIIKPSRKGTLRGARKRYEKLKKKREKHGLDKEGEAELARLVVLIEYLQDSRLWKRKNEYGLRWYSEGHFSAFKRIMGEHVFSKKYENIVKEIKFKNNIMNLFKYIGRGYRKEKITIEEKMPA